jgi:hypothetical protein
MSGGSRVSGTVIIVLGYGAGDVKVVPDVRFQGSIGGQAEDSLHGESSLVIEAAM